MSVKEGYHQIGDGAYIIPSSGIAPESEAMKRGADRNWQITQELFDSGVLTVGETIQGTPPAGTTLQENPDLVNTLFQYGESLLTEADTQSLEPSNKSTPDNQ